MRRLYDRSRDPHPRRKVEPSSRGSEVLDGVVVESYWGSMGDWPEVRIRLEDGTELRMTREGDVRRYAPGLRLRIFRHWVLMRADGVLLHEDRETAWVDVVDIEESYQRVSGVAPGPGGAGYRHKGHGNTVLFYWLPKRRTAEALASGLDSHAWDDVMGGAWLRITTAEPSAVRSILDAAVVEAGGRYDGAELIREEGDPVVRGPHDR